jgi:hypothetical protein
MAAKALLVAHKMNFNQCHFKEKPYFTECEIQQLRNVHRNDHKQIQDNLTR